MRTSTGAATATRAPTANSHARVSGDRYAHVVVVLVAAQVTHLLLIAISTAAIYFLLGLILLSPAVLAKWTGGGGTADGTILGMTIPVPQSLIHVTLVLCVLTFMYVCARSVGDDEYKRGFLDPLIEDLHVARSREVLRSARAAGLVGVGATPLGIAAESEMTLLIDADRLESD